MCVTSAGMALTQIKVTCEGRQSAAFHSALQSAARGHLLKTRSSKLRRKTKRPQTNPRTQPARAIGPPRLLSLKQSILRVRCVSPIHDVNGRFPRPL
jgi:hypothetical protein